MTPNPALLQEILTAFYAVAWAKQRLVFGRRSNGHVWQYSCAPGRDQWGAAVAQADYMTPSTFHQFHRAKRPYAYLGDIDTIPALFADVDYPRPALKPYWGEVYCDLLDMDIPPTLMLETDRGYHLFWHLRNPIRTVWWQKGGIWEPKPEGVKKLRWWKDISVMLAAALRHQGIPADMACVAQPSRLMRYPSRDNVRLWEPCNATTMQDLTDRLGQYRPVKVHSFQGREFHLMEELERVAEKGERNDRCWKLAVALLDLFRGEREPAERRLYQWCGQCSPAYPVREALPVMNWAERGYRRGGLIVVRKSLGMSKPEAARYVANLNRQSKDEAIWRAVETLRGEGIYDPWDCPAFLARRSGVSLSTIKRRKQSIQTGSNDY